MPVTDTPLRYPGGKSQLTPLVVDLLRTNDLFYGEYAEPFAGGAGIACSLLLSGYVSRIHINDLDPAIYAFWWCVVNHSERLCELIKSTAVTMDEWNRQRVVLAEERTDMLALGFATFFLNRTNRSGIIKGGVIGGLAQKGAYAIDCRFNKADLSRKIERLASHRDQIEVSNLDALKFLARFRRRPAVPTLLNIDPPYYVRGPELYASWFTARDHQALAKAVAGVKASWMITYDYTPETISLYAACPCFSNSLRYSAQVKRDGTELLVIDPRLIVPPWVQEGALTKSPSTASRRIATTPVA
jgi:DNA adenine methylase